LGPEGQERERQREREREREREERERRERERETCTLNGGAETGTRVAKEINKLKPRTISRREHTPRSWQAG
jgi:hypothetical protein